jgi:hypothetical protein
MNENLVEKFFTILVGVAISVTLTYFLWNWLCPLFGLPALTFLQAVGLKMLSSLLFKVHKIELEVSK